MQDGRIARLIERRNGAAKDRAQLIGERRSLISRAESEQRVDDQLTPAEDAEFRQLTEQMQQLDAEIRSYDERIAELGDAAEQRDNTEGAQALRRAAAGGQLPGGGQSEARTWLPGIAEYRQMQYEQRAVGTTGAFIPVGYSGTYFDLLRKRTAVLAAGPIQIPVDHAGSIVVPKVTSSVTIGGYAENTAITPADPGIGSITLDPKKFGAMTLVAREAMEDSAPQLRQVVANSLIRDTAVELDRQLVTGDGTGQNLRGLRNLSGATAGPTTTPNGVSMAAAGLGFGLLADTLAAYDAANADPDRAAWIMHSRTWASVRKLVDSQNRPLVSVDPTESVNPTLWGKPVFISNSLSIAETVGTSTDCSTLILADMSQVVVAVARQIELMISTDYAFNADQVAIRATVRYDIGVPQPTGVVLTPGVRP